LKAGVPRDPRKGKESPPKQRPPPNPLAKGGRKSGANA